jgi:hypothetical protein
VERKEGKKQAISCDGGQLLLFLSLSLFFFLFFFSSPFFLKPLVHISSRLSQAFALAYGWVGSYADVVMVNSSWTRGHIEELWGSRPRTDPFEVELPIIEIKVKLPRLPWRRLVGMKGVPAQRVYPPCNLTDLARLPLDRKLKRLKLVSIAQFRPEKVR